MAVLGIDEVGRGPWAGPLVVGAVVLGDSQKSEWDDLNDSKKLSLKKREEQNKIILENAVATELGWVSAEELDELGLSESLKVATRRAVSKISRTMFSEIIIDGTQNFLVGTELEEMVSVLPKADMKIKEVSAASIIAKVARDNYMKDIAKRYPEYGFEKHVGYGTKAHREALEKYGLCPEHRKSFRPVAKISNSEKIQKNDNSFPRAMKQTGATNRIGTTKQIGDLAETVVAEYLKSKGHKIIARNFRTKYYEIDIVSATKDRIFFTEVKYRKNISHGNPIEAIDKKKLKQMEFAANCFLQILAKKMKCRIEDLPKQKMAAASVSGEDYSIERWIELD